MTVSRALAAGAAAGLLCVGVLANLSCGRAEEPAAAGHAPQVVQTRGGIEMVLIPGGWFEMGSRRGKPDEAPVHKVWVDAFLMDRCEMTQEQYGRLILGNPSHFKGPQRPMEQVSWADAARYCNARSCAESLRPCYDEETAACDLDADGYRLPTEAEWECACRAGTGTDYSFGSDVRKMQEYAWFAENAAKQTHPVGQKKPSLWGLFDMHGNVAEWCNDVYDEGYYGRSPERNPRGPSDGRKYVLRGGAWNSSASACRSSYRVGEDPGFQDACFALDAIGFRCARRAPRELAGQGGPEGAPGAKTGFVYAPIYLEHKTGEGFPEGPQRLEAIVKRLRDKDLLARMVSLAPSPDGAQWITAIHSDGYVAWVKRSCEGGTGHLDSADVPISKRSYEAAVAAVGGVLAAVDAVMAGQVENAFCAIRPPGHHALKNKAMGFCIFNNVAIAARYIQKKHNLAKVLIVDWDVHHGNGTQDAFYDDPTVLYFSTHRSPFYPGTGAETEKGAGKGVGFTINVPLRAGSGDADLLRTYEEKLKPAAMAFKPDFVLISAGFDAHELDPLGGMKVSAQGYAGLTRIVRGIAQTCCKGRVVSVLEGGYNLEGLADSVEAHLRVLME